MGKIKTIMRWLGRFVLALAMCFGMLAAAFLIVGGMVYLADRHNNANVAKFKNEFSIGGEGLSLPPTVELDAIVNRRLAQLALVYDAKRNEKPLLLEKLPSANNVEAQEILKKIQALPTETENARKAFHHALDSAWEVYCQRYRERGEPWNHFLLGGKHDTIEEYLPKPRDWRKLIE